MTAIELITEVIPPLKHTDSGYKALQWMDEFKVSHLPVLKKGNYVGVVSETDILDKLDEDESLDKLFDHLPRPYVFSGVHIYEVLARIADHKISVMPILDEKEHYIGMTTMYELINKISNTGSVREVGGILVLEVNQIDYSMAQIAQIVESNNARILSSYIMSNPESANLEITLKINQVELDRIIRTFERFDYIIKASFQKSEALDDMQFRYDALMNYLKM